MASVVRAGKSWRAYVYNQGQRYTKTFPLKRDAETWARQKELDARGRLGDGRHTLDEALVRYSENVLRGHRGWDREMYRINAWRRRRPPVLPLDVPLENITTPQLAAWRDERLRIASPATVTRDLGLLRVILKLARLEWHWLTHDPFVGLRSPGCSTPREQVYTRQNICVLLRQLGYSPRQSVTTASQCVAVGFLIVLRTAMRRGEILELTWDNVFEGFCRLPRTKNGTTREVPITKKTARLLGKLPRGNTVLGLTMSAFKTAFIRAKNAAGLRSLHFHDTRHTACTWLARKVDVLTLCKICGWRNPKFALVYYNPKASDIARQLDGERP